MKVAIMGGVLDRGRPRSIVRFTTCLIYHISRLSNRQLKLYVVHREKSLPEYSHEGVERVIVPQFHYINRVLYKASFCGGPMLLPRVTLDPLILRKHHFDTIHYPALGWCGNVALLSSLSSARVVATVHGVAPLLLSAKVYFGENKSLRVCTALLRLLCKKVSLIVAVSESESRDVVKYLRVPKEKVRVIYHGVEEKFRVLPEKNVNEILERKYGVSSPFILHVSNCDPRKNVLSLMKAFYKAHKLGIKHKLVLVGPKSRMERILDQLEPLKPFFQSTLKVLEEISDDDLVRLYNTADAFIFPSLHESFGLPVIEAMACGCPVITSNFYALPEIAGDAAVLVDPYDVGALSTAMFELLTDQGLCEALSKKGLARAKMFLWKTCAEQYLKVYEELK